MFWLSTI